MLPAKEEVRRLLELLPDDASLEDIQYHIYVRQKILRGLEDVEAGRADLGKGIQARMSRWREPKGARQPPYRIWKRPRRSSEEILASMPQPLCKRPGPQPGR